MLRSGATHVDPGGGSSLRWLVLPVGAFWAVLRKNDYAYHTQYDSAGNLPAHQTSSLPGLQPRVVRFLCINGNPVVIRVCLSTWCKKEKNTHKLGSEGATPGHDPQRDTYGDCSACGLRVWASILPPDPWAGHGAVCALLYPPKATADYTCDGDGVPENPEPRALHNTSVHKKHSNTSTYVLAWPSRDMDSNLRFTRPGPQLGFDSVVSVPSPPPPPGAALHGTRRGKDLEIRLTGGARFAFAHSAGSSQSGTAL